eukprot:586159_1
MRNEINDYKPLDLLQDMNHIMQQHSSRIHSLNCQLPGNDCIHYKRSCTHGSDETNAILFNTHDSRLLKYIAMLDTAHCLIYSHGDDRESYEMYCSFKQCIQSV